MSSFVLALVCAATLLASPSGVPEVQRADAQQGAAQQAGTVAQAAAAAPVTMSQSDLSDYVLKQFGDGFKLAPLQPRGAAGQILRDAKALMLLTGDFDGDGVEDAVIVAKPPKNPLTGEEEFHYRVADPYDSYFGFGDPRTTRVFSGTDPDHERVLLIVHSWKEASPKAKYVIINMPFDNLAISQTVVKKKPRTVITATEGGLVDSQIYWDGKKYKYEPGDVGEE